MKNVVKFLASELPKKNWTDDQIEGLKMALFPKSSQFEPAYKNWLQRHPEMKDVKPMSEAELDELANMGL